MTESKPATYCSIVIPTWNRPEALARCLSGFARLDYPRERCEVVVVDDGGSASLDRIIADAADQMRVRLLRKEHGGPGRARNHGVLHAEGELIAFTDDDCTPEPDWLKVLAEASVARPDALLGGHTWNALPSNPYAATSQLLIDYLYAYYNTDAERGRFFTSNNMAASREVFLESGGFDPIFKRAAGEDRELCARWRHQGRPLVFVPEARVGHAHAMNLRSFVRQHLGYGRGAYHFRVREAEHTGRGVRIEPPGFYAGMLRRPFEEFRPREAWRAAALLVVAQAANAAGFFMKERHTNGTHANTANPAASVAPAKHD